ncbi:hypothetical protein KAX97_05355 [candidate division WOR-3 bacterium]|nr:hypothetical protein [candidate division WOR-3 bacterium]
MTISMEELINDNRRISDALDVVRRANDKMMHQLCILQLEHYNDNKEMDANV